MPSYAIIPSENSPNPCANCKPARLPHRVAWRAYSKSSMPALVSCQWLIAAGKASETWQSHHTAWFGKILNKLLTVWSLPTGPTTVSSEENDMYIIVINCIYRKQGAHYFSPVPKNTQKRSKKTMQHQCSSLWLSTMIITICDPMATIPPLEYCNCWLPIVTTIQWLWSSNSSQ